MVTHPDFFSLLVTAKFSLLGQVSVIRALADSEVSRCLLLGQVERGVITGGWRHHDASLWHAPMETIAHLSLIHI